MFSLWRCQIGPPQGFALGSILFYIYTFCLQDGLQVFKYHTYAGDIQIYQSCKLKSTKEFANRVNSDLRNLSLVSPQYLHHVVLLSTKEYAILWRGAKDLRIR